LLLCLALGAMGCMKREVSQADRDMCLGLDDLVAYGYKAEGTIRKNTVSKTYQINGTYILNCNVKTAAGDRMTIFMDTSLTTVSSASNATVMEKSEKTGVEIGFSVGGITVKPLKPEAGTKPTGSLSLLMKNKKPVGNLFMVRVGLKVYRVMLIGMYFDSQQQWEQLVGDKLAKLATYKPS